ncbi:hypothetical protein PsWM33_02253 [Pseudovibrio sp. WM33]|nr:hypothetical protein PsWM33_02253 [Pseudovibrio sp. WM33]
MLFMSLSVNIEPDKNKLRQEQEYYETHAESVSYGVWCAVFAVAVLLLGFF